MAFPRYVHGLWSAVADKINAIGDYFETLCATVIGRVTKSITTDVDGKAQLVNDLTDAELIPNLTYGVDEDGVRGFKPDPTSDFEHRHYHEEHTVTGAEATSGIIPITVTAYTPANHSLVVHREGSLMSIHAGDYTETSATEITFGAGILSEGENVVLDWWK